MSKIVIDARESGTSTGRYIDKLIENLHILKPKHDITILTKAPRIDYIKSIAPSFTATETPYKEFSFGEQLGFKKQLESLGPDLVHFGMVQQPIAVARERARIEGFLVGVHVEEPPAQQAVVELSQNCRSLRTE